VADEAAADVIVPGDSVTAEVLPDTTSPALFRMWYDGFSNPPAGPTLFLEPNSVNGPNLITLFVMAKDLGDLAGTAFYVAYNTELLRFSNGQNLLNFGDSGPYFTSNVVKELSPGVLTFGAARFCKDKIPWGSTDQCGGIEVGEAVKVAALTFELLGSGSGSLRFPKGHTLLLRPDRTAVEAKWIGGSFIIEEMEVQP